MSTQTMSTQAMSTQTMSSQSIVTQLDTRRPAARQAARPAVRQAAGQVRLTRRGRVVVFLAALLVVLAVAFTFVGGSMATGEAGTPETTTVIVVDQGQSLWSISAALAEDGDVYAMMDRIERINALDSAGLQAGQRLRVPTE